jgi:hypothetical protein
MSEKNLYESEDPTWTIHMQTLMKRKKNLEIAQTINDALFEYYSERGLEVPDWKMKRDPDWWINYLISLGIDPKNP